MRGAIPPLPQTYSWRGKDKVVPVSTKYYAIKTYPVL